MKLTIAAIKRYTFDNDIADNNKGMNWWDRKTKIPTNNKRFMTIFTFFILDCPSSRKTGGSKNRDGSRQPIHYTNVSSRASSFRVRGINKDLLSTIIAEIRRPMAKKGCYAALTASESVEENVRLIRSNSMLSDGDFELMVFRKRSDMSDAEAVYYYIRNAFAHGSFDVQSIRGSHVYRLESKRRDDICAQMRLKEQTLLSYIELASLKPGDIRSIRKKK